MDENEVGPLVHRLPSGDPDQHDQTLSDEGGLGSPQSPEDSVIRHANGEPVSVSGARKF
jgi:hypothetical protein